MENQPLSKLELGRMGYPFQATLTIAEVLFL